MVAGLVEQGTLDRSGHPCQHAPVGTELECHHDPGYDAKAKRDAKNLESELQECPTGSAGCGQIKRLEYGELGGQADRESWKDDVK